MCWYSVWGCSTLTNCFLYKRPLVSRLRFNTSIFLLLLQLYGLSKDRLSRWAIYNCSTNISGFLLQRSYDRTLVCHFTWEKKGDTIDDIENGDPRSFTSIIMNKDDDVDDDAHATRVNHIEGIYIWTFNPL